MDPFYFGLILFHLRSSFHLKYDACDGRNIFIIVDQYYSVYILLNFHSECAFNVCTCAIELILLPIIPQLTDFSIWDIDDTSYVISLTRWPNLAVKPEKYPEPASGTQIYQKKQYPKFPSEISPEILNLSNY